MVVENMRIYSLILICLFPFALFAQKTKRVEGEYIYRAPENVTIEQAKRIALERAQLETIAEAFGTNISQHNSTRVKNKNGNSDIDFLSLSSSEVKGEWIETIGEPVYSIGYEQGMLIVNCKVKGVIREIVSVAIDIRTKVLRNGTEDRFESSEFSNGDDLYLSLQSPVDGYLAVYLINYTSQNVYCMLPYSRSSDAVQRIEHDKSYLFFSSKDASAEYRNEVDEYTMTCDGTNECNEIYVIFSPNEFTKANSSHIKESMPRELPFKEFNKWLNKIRKIDNKIQVINKLLTIKN